MLNIVLFGPPGAGKGTQSEKLIEKYNLLHLSTGDLLRAEIKSATQLGIEAKSLIDKGELVPDAVVIGMIENKVNENPDVKGIIFDGFPRTVAQAEALDTVLNEKDTPISGMIALEVQDEELIKRLLERGKTSGRSDDQDESLIANRITEYNTKTKPVADFYAAQGKFASVVGVGSIDEIFENICGAVDKL